MKKLLLILVLSGVAFGQAKLPSVSGNPADGNCASWIRSGSAFKLGDSGAPCGTGTGGGVVDWEAILGTPTLFPPEAHNHVPIDITGLVLPQTAECTGTDKFSGFNSATGQFTCTADQSGDGGTGVITIGASGQGQSGSDQILATANDTNVTLSVASAASTHTFTAGWTGTLAKARGGTGQDNSALFFPASGTLALTSQIPPPQVQPDWNASSGLGQILNKPSLFSGSYTDLTNKPTIPAAQVQTDWNAISGMGQILNKPTFTTVATSGSYNDLLNKPTIPAAQVQPDWNAVSGMGQILNKPTLFSGAYADLTGKPTLGDSAAKNVGTTTGTVAAGNHTHTGVYEPADANITKLGSSISASEVAADVATQGELDAGLATKQATLTNAATIAKITESGGAPLWDGGAWPGGGGTGSRAWEAGFYYENIPTTNYVFLVRVVPTYSPAVTVTIPSGCYGSTLLASVAATGESTVAIKKGTTTICTATIAAAGTTATFSGTGGTLTTGDKLTIQMGTADATLRGVTLSIAGTW
jgi:hypothetical protein